MTKREALTELATRQDHLLKELKGLGQVMNLADSHELGIAVSFGTSVSDKLRRLAARPAMTKDVSFIEPV